MRFVNATFKTSRQIWKAEAQSWPPDAICLMAFYMRAEKNGILQARFGAVVGTWGYESKAKGAHRKYTGQNVVFLRWLSQA